MSEKSKASRVGGWLLLLVVMIMTIGVVSPGTAKAEYGDVVINNYSDEQGMRPVVFPHWFHRLRFRCKVCHADLGFKFQAGGNKIKMSNIIEGEFCGGCHNGEIAWSAENCDMCHSGKAGTKTVVHGSTVQSLVTPVSIQKFTKDEKGQYEK